MPLSPSASAVLVGLTIFFVAGYQTVVYRDILSLTQQDFIRIPVHILIEVALAFSICLWGSLGLAGTFKPISPYATQKGLDAQTYRPDFMSFNHRGQLLPLEIPPLRGSFQNDSLASNSSQN